MQEDDLDVPDVKKRRPAAENESDEGNVHLKAVVCVSSDNDVPQIAVDAEVTDVSVALAAVIDKEKPGGVQLTYDELSQAAYTVAEEKEGAVSNSANLVSSDVSKQQESMQCTSNVAVDAVVADVSAALTALMDTEKPDDAEVTSSELILEASDALAEEKAADSVGDLPNVVEQESMHGASVQNDSMEGQTELESMIVNISDDEDLPDLAADAVVGDESLALMDKEEPDDVVQEKEDKAAGDAGDLPDAVEQESVHGTSVQNDSKEGQTELESMIVNISDDEDLPNLAADAVVSDKSQALMDKEESDDVAEEKEHETAADIGGDLPDAVVQESEKTDDAKVTSSELILEASDAVADEKEYKAAGDAGGDLPDAVEQKSVHGTSVQNDSKEEHTELESMIVNISDDEDLPNLAADAVVNESLALMNKKEPDDVAEEKEDKAAGDVGSGLPDAVEQESMQCPSVHNDRKEGQTEQENIIVNVSSDEDVPNLAADAVVSDESQALMDKKEPDDVAEEKEDEAAGDVGDLPVAVEQESMQCTSVVVNISADENLPNLAADAVVGDVSRVLMDNEKPDDVQLTSDELTQVADAVTDKNEVTVSDNTHLISSDAVLEEHESSVVQLLKEAGEQSSEICDVDHSSLTHEVTEKVEASRSLMLSSEVLESVSNDSTVSYKSSEMVEESSSVSHTESFTPAGCDKPVEFGVLSIEPGAESAELWSGLSSDDQHYFPPADNRQQQLSETVVQERGDDAEETLQSASQDATASDADADAADDDNVVDDVDDDDVEIDLL